MINLKTACEIVAKDLKTKGFILRNKCWDLGDCWVFDWGLKNDPNIIKSSGAMTMINKSNGILSEFVFGVPGTETFDKLIKAPIIDISGFLKNK